MSVFAGIFWLQIESTTPFQLMEWDIYGQPEVEPAPPYPAPAEIGAVASLPAVPLARTWDELILHEVPFAAQAPFGEWSDPRYQDGCEEASVLMAIKAVRQEDLSREEARDEIARLSQFQSDNYGSYIDTSASATLARLVEGYFKYQGRVEYGIDLKRVLRSKLVLGIADGSVQVDGREIYTAKDLRVGLFTSTEDF